MKTFIKILLCTIPIFVFGQSKGVSWVKVSSWHEVLEMAKAEHKYIFVDCFATWCGPCKIMDRDVFANSLFADSIRNEFIAVKMQMDQSDKDDTIIKSLYQDAQRLGVDYRVNAYPTFSIFDSNGIIKSKETGLKTVDELIRLSSKALTKRGKYEDKYADYDRMMEEYNSGKRDYSNFPYMISSSELLGKSALADQLTSEYFFYLKDKPLSFILNKTILQFLETHIALQSKYFDIFLRYHEMVDSIMGRAGYSNNVVLHQVIANEYTYPFLNRCNQDSVLMKDPPWNELSNEIKGFVDQELVVRNDLEAKIAWYKGQKKWARYFDLFLQKVQTYGIDSTASFVDYQINDFAWWVFEFSNRDSINARAVELMEGVIRRTVRSGEPVYSYYDTYANLLYRSSKVKDAVSFENKAIADATEWLLKDPDNAEGYKSSIDDFKIVLNKMENRKPTWISDN